MWSWQEGVLEEVEDQIQGETPPLQLSGVVFWWGIFVILFCVNHHSCCYKKPPRYTQTPKLTGPLTWYGMLCWSAIDRVPIWGNRPLFPSPHEKHSNPCLCQATLHPDTYTDTLM